MINTGGEGEKEGERGKGGRGRAVHTHVSAQVVARRRQDARRVGVDRTLHQRWPLVAFRTGAWGLRV